MVTSRAVVGSSAIRRSGSLARDMAIMTRWRWPPESSCGIGGEAARRIADAHQIEQLQGAPPRRVAGHALVQQQGLVDLLFHRVQGIERGHGLLKDHRDLVAADLAQEGLLAADHLLAAEADGGLGLCWARG